MSFEASILPSVALGVIFPPTAIEPAVTLKSPVAKVNIVEPSKVKFVSATAALDVPYH